MAKKEEEHKMFYPYYPPQGDDLITNYIRFQQFLDEQKKKKDTEAKKKPEPIKFSFLETFGLAVMFGPAIGFGYLYAVKYALHTVDMWFK